MLVKIVEMLKVIMLVIVIVYKNKSKIFKGMDCILLSNRYFFKNRKIFILIFFVIIECKLVV